MYRHIQKAVFAECKKWSIQISVDMLPHYVYLWVLKLIYNIMFGFQWTKVRGPGGSRFKETILYGQLCATEWTNKAFIEYETDKNSDARQKKPFKPLTPSIRLGKQNARSLSVFVCVCVSARMHVCVCERGSKFRWGNMCVRVGRGEGRAVCHF